MQCQKALVQRRKADASCGDMPLLMGRFKKRDPQRCGDPPSVTATGLKHGHIAVRLIPGLGGRADGANRRFRRQFCHQAFHHLRQLPYMRKNGLALAKAALARLHGEQQAGKGDHLSLRVHRGGGSGITAGIQTQHCVHGDQPSCLSRSMAPSTPLM